MTDADRTFAERLRQRIDSDPELTAAGLSTAAGLDNSTIRHLLSGRTKNVRVDTALRICAALGTTLDEFMGEPRNDAARALDRLRAELGEAELRQLLGYGQALRDRRQSDPPTSGRGTPRDDE